MGQPGLPEKIPFVVMATLALGTVQFGLPYGIANRSGQVPVDEVHAILAQAAVQRVDMLDTAVAYGESERRLGALGVDGWKVVSKLPPIAPDCADASAWVRDNVAGSLERLRIPKLYGLLLHRACDLLGPHGSAIHAALTDLRGAGLIGRIGVSVYDPDELAELCPRFALDLVQAPFNIVDRRLATSGWLKRLHDAGVEVHVRSAFLQGLLLMDPGSRPERFAQWAGLWSAWAEWLHEVSLSPLQACLRFALSQPQISRVVVGVDSRAHLQQILDARGMLGAEPPESLTSTDSGLINPLSWITP